MLSLPCDSENMSYRWGGEQRSLITPPHTKSLNLGQDKQTGLEYPAPHTTRNVAWHAAVMLLHLCGLLAFDKVWRKVGKLGAAPTGVLLRFRRRMLLLLGYLGQDGLQATHPGFAATAKLTEENSSFPHTRQLLHTKLFVCSGKRRWETRYGVVLVPS